MCEPIHGKQDTEQDYQLFFAKSGRTHTVTETYAMTEGSMTW